MTGLAHYLTYHYKPGARGENGFTDCWGLVRMVRAEMYGFSWLPEFAQALPFRPGKVDAAYKEQAAKMIQVEPREGAIAACLRKGVCLHVAILVSGNRVLEIKKKGSRARLLKLGDWLREYPAPLWEVRYYCEAKR